MGAAAKVTLLLAMVAIVLGAQLLERELAARRGQLQPGHKSALAIGATGSRVPLEKLTEPIPDPGLPLCPPGEPGGGPSAGIPGVDDAPASPTGERPYVIQSGDTLSKIAKKTLGHETAWQLIYQRNKAAIPDVSRLKVGTTLEIPAATRPDAPAQTRPDARSVPARKLTTGPHPR